MGAIAPAVAAEDSAAPAAPSAEQAPAPVALEADELSFDETSGVATASGSVVIEYEDRKLLADQVTYDQRNNFMTASGNVELTEPGGEIIFADYVELTGDLKRGFADGLQLLLTDNARMAAAYADRVDGNRTILNKVVYSPCEACPDNPDRPLLWQVKAVEVIHDQQAQDIIFKDASFEVMGVPIAWVPEIRHPDPTVTQREGFLTPEFGSTQRLGIYGRGFYYQPLGETTDVTYEVLGSMRKGVLAGAEVRHHLNFGLIEVSGSITKSSYETGPQNAEVFHDSRVRGHLFGEARFAINDQWRAGADLALTSDTRFLREYEYTDDDILENRLFTEWFDDRDHALLEAVYLDDLRPGTVEDEPIVLPNLQMEFVSDAGAVFGGRWKLGAGALGLTRQDGPDTNRVHGLAEWERRDVFGFGLETTVDLSALALVHHYDDQQDAPNPSINEDQGVEFRFLPQASLTVRLPFARRYGEMTHLIEPIGSIILAPNLGGDSDVPNEDSRDIDFDAANLFSRNRFPGLDRLESGIRTAYGVQSTWMWDDGGHASLFLGQAWRLEDDESLPVGSGLDEEFSDFVGRATLRPARWLDLDFRFRLDNDAFDDRRHELFARAGSDRFRIATSYVFAEDIAGSGIGDQQELSIGATAELAEHWTVSGFHRRDLGGNGGSQLHGLAVSYVDECFAISLEGERDFSQRTGLDGSESVYLRLALRGFGDYRRPDFTDRLFQYERWQEGRR
ncbi:MAG: LPS assembly protein LptD [Alphaproteobacteria bacterium]